MEKGRNKKLSKCIVDWERQIEREMCINFAHVTDRNEHYKSIATEPHYVYTEFEANVSFLTRRCGGFEPHGVSNLGNIGTALLQDSFRIENWCRLKIRSRQR